MLKFLLMETKIIKVNNASDLIINEAAEIIKAGELVAFPTETVYGLGANGFDESACKKIYEVKNRPPIKPLSLMVADFDMINKIADVTPLAEKLIKKFLPGPLTLILPKREIVPDFVTADQKTVGIRMPDNEIALTLIKAADCPIAAPSANISGEESPTTAEEVLKSFNKKIPLILDGGTCKFKISSTIIDLSGECPIIRREGAIDKKILYKVIGGF